MRFGLGRKQGGKPRPGRRARTPTVLQMEAVECGAAALAIILAHFGRWVPLEQLRIACGVSRDGSKASNIVKAARSFGLVAKGFKKEPGDLRVLKPPTIIHWNFNHFLVLEGMRKGKVYLNDPGLGPLIMTEEELDQAFTGVVLTFEREPGFKRGGEPPRLLASLKKRLVAARAALAFVILVGLALVVPGLVVPVFSKVFVDSVLLEGRHDWLQPLLLAMGITAALTAVLTWMQQTYLLRLESKMALSSSSRFLWHVLRLPVEFFNQRFHGDVSSRVGINDRVAQLLSRDLATNALGVLMFQYDPLLTLAGVAIVSLNMVALRIVSRKRVDRSYRLLQQQGKLLGTAIGGLQMIETIKASGGEADLYARWSGYQAKVVNTRQELERYTQLLDAVPPLLAALNSAVVLGLGGLRVMNGALSLGGLVAFQALMTSFIAPVSRLVNLGGRLQAVEGDMARLDDVLRYPGERDDQLPGLRRSEHLSLRGHGAGEPDALGFDGAAARGRRGGQGRLHSRRRRGPLRRLRQPGPGGGRELERRPAAAPGDRPLPGQPAFAAGAGRGHQRPRSRHRERDRREPAPAGLHVPDRRPPAEHDPRRRRNHRAGQGQGRPARHPRRAAGDGGPLRSAHQHGVTG